MKPNSDLLLTPPRARLAFRVGIVGHRPNRLPSDPEALDALREVIRTILEEVQVGTDRINAAGHLPPLYAAERPILRAISPLAEGSDRIFAEEALKLGYELCCPIPFAQEKFEESFVSAGEPHEPNSVEHFHDLLQQAVNGAGLTKFELDGDQTDSGAAYGAAGRVVLNQSDLLVVVWDGDKAAGEGGTVETLAQAIRFHVPVLWIYPFAPDKWQQLRDEADLEFLNARTGSCTPLKIWPAERGRRRQQIAETVAEIVSHELGPPSRWSERSDDRATTITNFAIYLSERKPPLNLAFFWKFFRNAVGDAEVKGQEVRVRNFVEQIREDWPILSDPEFATNSAATIGLPSPITNWANEKLRAHYAWPDKLADLYADAFRSAYVFSYLLAALAVFVALLPMAAGWQGDPKMSALEIFCIAAEFIIMALILILLIYGSRRHWHDRWMEYRLLAELIRQIRCLIPLGGGRPFPRVPDYLTGWGDPTQSWMYWHMRAIARQTGIPNGKVDPDYVRDCLDYLAGVVAGPFSGQLRFHRTNAARYDHIHHRLHKATVILFALTIVGITLHLSFAFLAPATSWIFTPLDRWLVLSSATLPALGAALAGINNQGEFVRLAKRSIAMASRFEKFRETIDMLRGGLAEGKSVRLADVIPLASQITDVMIQEVVDWRVMFFDRQQTT